MSLRKLSRDGHTVQGCIWAFCLVTHIAGVGNLHSRPCFLPRPFPLTRLAVFPLTASHCRSKLVTKFSQLNHLLCEMGTPHSISARVISCLIPTRGIKSSYAWKIKHVVNGDGFCFLGGGGGRRVVSVCVQGLLDVFHFQSIAHRHLAV